MPIVFIATALGIIANLSDKIQIGKLSNFFKSGITWILGLVITIFVSILSLEGSLTSNVDGLTAKGIKTATSTFVPVVGKALGDSVDTVLGATSLLKNSIGIVGMFVIPSYPADNILDAIAVGIVSGMASTGVNQIYKQVKNNARH